MTANITGILSTIADKTPTIELAIVGPNPSYKISDTKVNIR